MIVLSDGETNHGVRDLAGFRRIAQRCRQREIAISTIGVGVDYNERLLSTVAFESNGLHHFVEDETSLAQVFRAETESVVKAVASNTEARIALAPGVRLHKVFDRSFDRRGQEVVVPLGTFAPGETKTVLIEVELDGSAQARGPRSVAEVHLGFDDHAVGSRQDVSAGLATAVANRTAKLDPFVAARLERARTSAALEEANDLAKRGRVVAARQRLARRAAALRKSAVEHRSPFDARSEDIDESFKRQIDFADDAVSAFDEAARPTARPKAKPRAVRRNQEAANAFDL
jgi:Ca-activated chloride channel family protein